LSTPPAARKPPEGTARSLPAKPSAVPLRSCASLYRLLTVPPNRRSGQATAEMTPRPFFPAPKKRQRMALLRARKAPGRTDRLWYRGDRGADADASMSLREAPDPAALTRSRSSVPGHPAHRFYPLGVGALTISGGSAGGVRRPLPASARSTLPHAPQDANRHPRGVPPRHVRTPSAAVPPVSQPSSRILRASARKAMPRWLIAFFSSGLISAVVRVSPSGTKIGS